jgi:hypothetical protein
LKRILSAGLLILLLYNMFGLAIGVFFFEKDFQTATELHVNDEFRIIKFPIVSLPYAVSWENTNDADQKIENDTAYVTLKTNLSARERFLELADQVITTQRNPSDQTPFQKAIRSLSDLVKVYWVSAGMIIFERISVLIKEPSQYRDGSLFLKVPFLALLSPPPEC